MTMPDYGTARGDVTSPLDALIEDATRELSAPAVSAKPETATKEKRGPLEEATSQLGDKTLEDLLAERAAEKARVRAAKDAAFAALSEEEKMAAIDEQVQQLLTEEGIYSRNQKASKAPKEAMGGDDSSSSSDSDGASSSSSDSDSSDEDGAVSAKAVVTREQKEEFAELMRKYRKPAVTELDRARDTYYETEYMFDQATDEVDLETFRDDRYKHGRIAVAAPFRTYSNAFCLFTVHAMNSTPDVLFQSITSYQDGLRVRGARSAGGAVQGEGGGAPGQAVEQARALADAPAAHPRHGHQRRVNAVVLAFWDTIASVLLA
jgi:hypothetical protein